MNPFIVELLNQIESSKGEAKQTCLLQLAFLVERNFGRNKHDPLHREYLPDTLLSLRLTNEDRRDILSKIDSLLAGGSLSIDEKISCISALKNMPGLPTLEIILSFLERNHKTVNERDLYSILATFLPWSYTDDQTELAQKLFEKYKTRRILEVLQNRGDAALNEQVLRALLVLDQCEGKEPVQLPNPLTPSWEEMDKPTQMLVLWMDLNRAISAFAGANPMPISSIIPWDCADPKISGIWQEITHPANLSSLEDWLAGQKANEQPTEWTEQAIRICRKRAEQHETEN